MRLSAQRGEKICGIHKVPEPSKELVETAEAVSAFWRCHVESSISLAGSRDRNEMTTLISLAYEA